MFSLQSLQKLWAFLNLCSSPDLCVDPEQITQPYISCRQWLVKCRRTLSASECVWSLIRLNAQDPASLRCFEAKLTLMHHSKPLHRMQKHNRSWEKPCPMKIWYEGTSWKELSHIKERSSKAHARQVMRNQKWPLQARERDRERERLRWKKQR